MKCSTKNVQFDIFKAFFLKFPTEASTEESALDLDSLFKSFASNSLPSKNRVISGDTYMLHQCAFDSANNIWKIQILHLRENMLPGIADMDGSFELIKLSETQYPAESTTMLFDVSTQLLYMQRNLYGISVRNFEILLMQLVDNKSPVKLKPVMVNSQIKKMTNSRFYHSILIAVDRDQLDRDPGNSVLQIARSMSQYEGKIITFKLGFGHYRKNFLNPDRTSQLIREAYDFPGTQKLHVTSSASEDTKCELIDLLNDKKSYLCKMKFSRSFPITHERLCDCCLNQILGEKSNSIY